MLVLAHAGITLGAASLLAQLAQPRTSSATPPVEARPGRLAAWFRPLGRLTDIRLLLVGSLLPDIIDKPLGQVVLGETISNGRIYGHTLLFVALLAVVGLRLWRQGLGNWMLVLASGSLAHLALDSMWRDPATLFWPIAGFAFRSVDPSEWLPNILRSLLSDPAVYVPEAVGAMVLLWFAFGLVRQRRILAFVRAGRADGLSPPGRRSRRRGSPGPAPPSGGNAAWH